MTDVRIGPDARPGFGRVLLKLGGEMFGGGGVGVDPDLVETVARQIAEVVTSGPQMAVVIGGGNFFRGAELHDRGMDRARADYMGMLGTVMNCLALQDFLEREHGVDTRVQTAITMGQVAAAYIPRRAIRHLEKKGVCIFAAGTGNPYFTPDTTPTLRANEMGCQAIFKGTKVDGVYDKDPKKHADARRYTKVSYDEVLEKHLGVMDATAIALARDNHLPIIVFSLDEPGGFRGILAGEGTYTTVR